MAHDGGMTADQPAQTQPARTQPARAQPGKPSALAALVVVAQGLLTVWLSFAFIPVGAALVVANIVGAIVTRGTVRTLFIVFASIGGVICAFILLFLVAVGSGTFTS